MPPVVVSLPASGNVLVTAPTGVAALVVQGQTLHSNPGPGIPNGTTAAFGNMHSDSRRKVLAQMECLVIDEISMVRPALAPPRYSSPSVTVSCAVRLQCFFWNCC